MALVWSPNGSAYAHNLFSRASAPVIFPLFPFFYFSFFFFLSSLIIWIPLKHSEASYQLLDILECSRSTPYNGIPSGIWLVSSLDCSRVYAMQRDTSNCICREEVEIIWKMACTEKWIVKQVFPLWNDPFMPLQPSEVHPCVLKHTQYRHFSLTLKYLNSFLLHFCPSLFNFALKF